MTAPPFPVPSCWAGTPDDYAAAMNGAGFTWDGGNRWWAWRGAGA